MNLLIFKTDIASRRRIRTVRSVFKRYPSITNWSVDLEDIDNVLRIESSSNVNDRDIVTLLATHGFYCEVLPD